MSQKLALLQQLMHCVYLQIPTETIAAVLHNHDGNVESSIEALLSVCSPAQSSEKVSRLGTLMTLTLDVPVCTLVMQVSV